MSEAPDESAQSPEPVSVPAAEAEPLSPKATGLAAKARDLAELRTAVVEAANVGAGLWISYLFVLFYFLVAVGGVSHRNLLFENPVRLPFLNVDLPLIGFFALGPLIFIIVHAYVLLHFVLLATKIGVFDSELRSQIPDEDLRTRLRRQLPSNIFVQYLAGPREVRSGVMGIMLQSIALISLVIGPIALLVFFQLRFLPYHHEAITWWHRIAIVADLALLWLLWPSIARGGTIAHAWRDMRRSVVAAVALVSVVPVLLTFTIATFPGEWLEEHLPGNALHEFLVVGTVNLTTRQPSSLLTNRLVLPGLEGSSGAESFSLRARHLEGAVLIGANLRKADLTGALLQGASLNGADLRDVRFGCEDDQPTDSAQAAEETTEKVEREICAGLAGAVLNGANLQHATLNHADLRGAQLYGTQLQDASLNYADLRGARLEKANLEGASLKYAQIQFTTLASAMLQGATLDRALLYGSNLQGAHLAAASFVGTKLQAADLSASKLQGAWLVQTSLQGATMHGAYLDGAILNAAEMQGVEFRPQSLHAASLQNVRAWRALVRAPFQQSIVSGTVTTATRECTPEERHAGKKTCEWSAPDYDQLTHAMSLSGSDSPLLAEALKRIAHIDPRTPARPDDAQSAELWLAQEHSGLTAENFQKELAEVWTHFGCDAENAPYVARALSGRLLQEFSSSSPFPASIAARFLDEGKCAGARGLPADVKASLMQLQGATEQKSQ